MVPACGTRCIAPVKEKIKGFVAEFKHVAAKITAQIEAIFRRQSKIDFGIQVVKIVIGNRIIICPALICFIDGAGNNIGIRTPAADDKRRFIFLNRAFNGQTA